MTTAEGKNSSISCEAQLDGLNLLANAGIFSTDVHLNITSWNFWLEANSGKTSQLVVGRNLLEVFPEIAERGMNSFYEQALRGQVIVLSQPLHRYLIRLPAAADSRLGTPMPQSARIAPLMDGEVLVGTMTLIDDVTDRVVREAELSVRARQQSAIASLSREALASRDLDSLFRSAVSVIAETLDAGHCAILEIDGDVSRLKAGLGWASDPHSIMERLGGNSQTEFVLQSDNPVVIADLNAERRFDPPQFLRDAAISSGVVVPICCNGKGCALLGVYMTRPWTRSPESLDFLKAVANTLGTALERDVLERNLRNRAQELLNADQRKNEFLAMLAHELRNPLAPIRGAVQLLYAKSSEDEEIRSVHEMVERQIRQMTRLVDDLLDVSRITRGKVELRFDTIDLAAAVHQALENCRPQLEIHRHHLTTEIPSLPMPVRGDLTRLAQAVGNLIHNAAKYTDPGGDIFVRVERDGSDYTIKVRDNGIGISPEMLPHIFDLFTQVDHSLARSEGGLGIGLTLVRTLIDMHGGTVKVHSAGKNQGSEFTVRLPALSQDTKLSGSAQPAALRKEATPSRRVLIVDDNQDAADTLRLLVKALGHEPSSVHSGGEALEEARRNHPDFVFLDIGLPGMDGFAVARQLRKDHPGSKMTIIALSGYAENANQSKDAGFDLHLLKPIELRVLQRLLAQPSSS